jgi:hypothetical protein
MALFDKIGEHISYWGRVIGRVPSVIKSWFDHYQAWAAWGAFVFVLLAIYGVVSSVDTAKASALLLAIFTPSVLTWALGVALLIALLEASRQYAKSLQQQAAELKLEIQRRNQDDRTTAQTLRREIEDKTREIDDRVRDIARLERELEAARGANSRHIRYLADARIRGLAILKHLRASASPDLLRPSVDAWLQPVTQYVREHLPVQDVWFSKPVPGRFALTFDDTPDIERTVNEYLQRLEGLLDALNNQVQRTVADVRGIEVSLPSGPTIGPVMDDPNQR